MRALCIAASLTLAAHAVAQDGWKRLDGQPVPEIHVEDWYNVVGQISGVADLKGKVFLLEFFATW